MLEIWLKKKRERRRQKSQEKDEARGTYTGHTGNGIYGVLRYLKPLLVQGRHIEGRVRSRYPNFTCELQIAGRSSISEDVLICSKSERK